MCGVFSNLILAIKPIICFTVFHLTVSCREGESTGFENRCVDIVKHDVAYLFASFNW